MPCDCVWLNVQGSPGQVPLCLKMETETLYFFKELHVEQSKKKGGGFYPLTLVMLCFLFHLHLVTQALAALHKVQSGTSYASLS